MSASAIGIEVLSSLLLLLIFLQPGTTQFLDPECGFRYAPVSTARIHKGQNAGVTSSPWMVFILTTDDFFICGGTLITHRLVLTAAHCYHKHRNLKARLGEFNRDWHDGKCHDTVDGDKYCNYREEINVELGEMHTRFNNYSLVNDIAILRLARRVEYTENIRPICIVVDKRWRDYIDGMETLTVTGWGYTDSSARSSRILQTLVIKRQPPEECTWYINRTPFSNEFCMGNEDSSVCNGDSGGPVGKLIKYQGWPRFIQVGVASLTNHQCSKASISTDLLSHVDWILLMDEVYGKEYIPYNPIPTRAPTTRWTPTTRRTPTTRGDPIRWPPITWIGDSDEE